MIVKINGKEKSLACLVPDKSRIKSDSALLSCHERTLCDCEVIQLLETVRRNEAKMREALVVTKNKLEECKDELYGQGLEVSGWHLNGSLEPLDSWFDENDWEPVEAKQALDKLEEW